MGILRLLLALSVIAAHGGVIWKFNLVEGPVAVQAFFMISGFYMSLILNEKYTGVHSSYSLFLKNRFLRLYPLYWIVWIATILMVAGFILLKPGGNLSIFQFFRDAEPGPLTWIVLAFTNLFIFGQDLLMFAGIDTQGSLYATSTFADPPMTAFLIVPQSWTISMELFFYLLAPFILRKGWKVVSVILVISLLTRFLLFYHLGYRQDPWTYRFFPAELTFFLLGYFSYLVYVRLRAHQHRWIGFSKPAILIMTAFVMAYSFLPGMEIPNFPFHGLQMIFLATVFISIPFLFLGQRDQPVDRLLGELSYPVYLVHISVIMFASGLGIFQGYPWVVIPLSLLAGFLLHKWVSEPIERKRQQPFRKF